MNRNDPSVKILAIRVAAGNTSDVCPTCGRKDYSPYRRFDSYGKVMEGCVDACHTGRLVTPSESNRWQNRKEAIAIRRSEFAHLNSL